MKHSFRVTLILLAMFFVAQLIGLYISSVYAPIVTANINESTGEVINTTSYNIPYGLAPPEDIEPTSSVISIVIALIIAVLLMLTLMKLRAEIFLRIWFFVVVTIGIALALNGFILSIPQSAIISLIVALPLAYLKIFKRNIIVHNATELLIYPGIASLFIPLLSLWSVVILLIIISLYDMYAVWHAGFMQKMAKYQIEKVRVFSGFFVPYMAKKDRLALKLAKEKGKKGKKVPVQIAILGGGDIVFPIILGGVVLHAWGLIPALIIAIGATAALAALFYMSQKGKFYPAMPFITTGCFIALGIAYLFR